MIKPSPCLLNGRSVSEHTNSSLNFCQISTGDNGWGLIIDSNLNQTQYYLYEKILICILSYILEIITSMTFILTNLESRWTPIHKLDSLVHFDGSNRCIDVFWNHISSIQQANCHEFSSPWVDANHLTVWLKTFFGYFIYRDLLVVCLKWSSPLHKG